MGNEAIAFGAIAAGVNVVSGYPGTPSTEVLETIAKNNPGDIHVEWSTNEKAAMEIAAGASYCGARAMVTMKQVGLNVASDPFMCSAYIGVGGGLVVLVADDPGPISSQTEQDTRRFASFSKVPVFDPISPQEAYEMVSDAFAISEEFSTPVILRTTTRVSHGGAVVDISDSREEREIAGFERSPKWIEFPRRAYQAHCEINERLQIIAERFSSYRLNAIEELVIGGDDPTWRIGIACGGVSYTYVREVLGEISKFIELGEAVSVSLLKIATPFPFPDDLGARFLEGVDNVICFEELDGVIEDALIAVCGKRHIGVDVHGKHDGFVRAAGESSVDAVASELASYLSRLGIGVKRMAAKREASSDGFELPTRPPVLCAGCPHRGSFYAVKKAMQGRKAFFCGDIGCYTLGNAQPLDMVDTCLCMGADITIAQGMKIVEPDATCFAFIGDSTFFASGITGVVNSIYNGNEIKIIVLDNSTTAMTGHQPHPGTGVRMSGDPSREPTPVSIEKVLEAIGVTPVLTVDPNDFDAACAAVNEIVEAPSTAAIIFKSPCAAKARSNRMARIDAQRCIGCGKCIRELGCPGLFKPGDKAMIDESLCYGCSLCAQICPVGAISIEEV